MNFKLEIFLFKLSFIFIIFDSFPIPIDFVYRPLSIFPLVILAFSRLYFLFINRGVYIPKKILFILTTVLLISIYQSSIIFKDFSGLNKFVIELILIFIIYNGFMRGFELSVDEKGIKFNLRSSFKLVLYVLIFFGLTQLLFNILNLEDISNSIRSLFSYRGNNSNRISFFSGEPSMGVRIIVLFICMYSFILEKKIPKTMLFLIVFLILISGSTFGILFIILFGFFYLLLKSSVKTIFKNILIFLFFGNLIYLILPFIMDYMSPYAQKKINIVYQIFSFIDIETFFLIAEKDGSFFLRVFNPIIGFIIFLNNLFGVGGENFKFEYIGTINEYFPFALNHNTVKNVLFEGSGITPKSLISKMLAEFGLFGLWMILYSINKLWKITKNHSNLYLLFIFIVVLIINYDSYIYIPLIFPISLFYFINKKTDDLHNYNKLQ